MAKARGRYMIFDEEKYCKELMNDTRVNKQTFTQTDINLLARYLRHTGKQNPEIRKELSTFLYSRTDLSEYNAGRHARKAVRDLNIHRLRENTDIVIWQEELDKISTLKSKRLQKFMFALLFISKYAKYNSNMIDSDSKNYDSLYYKYPLSYAWNVAGSNPSGEVRNSSLHELYLEGFIEATYSGSLKILIEKKNGTDDEKRYYLRPTHEIIYFLESFKNPLVAQCVECGAWIKKKKSTKTMKYCSECSERIKKEKTLERVKKHRNKKV